MDKKEIYDVSSYSHYGFIAIIFGIVGFCFVMLPGYFLSNVFLRITVEVIMGFLAITFGFYAYHGKKQKDKWGLRGIGLGIILLIIALFTYFVWSIVIVD